MGRCHGALPRLPLAAPTPPCAGPYCAASLPSFQDFSKFDIQLRMVAARLDDGSLLLVSPVAPTPEALSLLGGLGGRVAHIVLPSSSPEHWCALLCDWATARWHCLRSLLQPGRRAASLANRPYADHPSCLHPLLHHGRLPSRLPPRSQVVWARPVSRLS